MLTWCSTIFIKINNFIHKHTFALCGKLSQKSKFGIAWQIAILAIKVYTGYLWVKLLLATLEKIFA